MENAAKDEVLKKVNGGTDEEEPEGPEGPVFHGYLVGDDCLACGVCAEMCPAGAIRRY
ncbi:MAG: 4Fe-4S binding protein [Erysipelotrichaceae bacterium]|nr:4Fe-4S binding protein [Erysipelotrichaceae bacterium]MBQ2078854.1 4Fe-4S binding protein [Erysipelotrichaceae bacterium]